MSSEEIFHLPLNVYIIILGIGLFILMLSLIFCCYLFRFATHTCTRLGRFKILKKTKVLQKKKVFEQIVQYHKNIVNWKNANVIILLSKSHLWANLPCIYFNGGEIKPVTKDQENFFLNNCKVQCFGRISKIPPSNIYNPCRRRVCVIRLWPWVPLHTKGQALHWKNEMWNSDFLARREKFEACHLTQLTSATSCQMLLLALTMLHGICAPAKVWNSSRKTQIKFEFEGKKERKKADAVEKLASTVSLFASTCCSEFLTVCSCRTHAHAGRYLKLALCEFQLAAASRVVEAAGWNVSWAAQSCSRAARGRVSMTPTLDCVCVGVVVCL